MTEKEKYIAFRLTNDRKELLNKVKELDQFSSLKKDSKVFDKLLRTALENPESFGGVFDSEDNEIIDAIADNQKNQDAFNFELLNIIKRLFIKMNKIDSDITDIKENMGLNTVLDSMKPMFGNDKRVTNQYDK